MSWRSTLETGGVTAEAYRGHTQCVDRDHLKQNRSLDEAQVNRWDWVRI